MLNQTEKNIVLRFIDKYEKQCKDLEGSLKYFGLNNVIKILLPIPKSKSDYPINIKHCKDQIEKFDYYIEEIRLLLEDNDFDKTRNYWYKSILSAYEILLQMNIKLLVALEVNSKNRINIAYYMVDDDEYSELRKKFDFLCDTAHYTVDRVKLDLDIKYNLRIKRNLDFY